MTAFEFQPGDLVFDDFRIATMASESPPFGLLEHGRLVIRGSQIADVREASKDAIPAGPLVVHGDGQLITPGLIDCHTHMIYVGDRSGEFAQRVRGTSYEAIARAGGGILATVQAIRQATMEQLYQVGSRRIENWLRQGVTTLEIKSGYGLDLENERKMLLVADELSRDSPIDVTTTLLAAHAVPAEFAGRTDDYVDYVCNDIVPATADLASAIDVFCESIAFSVAQSRRVLEAGRQHGLHVKIHAEQLTLTGGTAMACELGALSADHLEYLDEPGVQAMADHGTVASLLPGAYYFLQLRQRPPISLFRQYGVPMAVASDLNPGSSPIGSVFWILNLVCLLYGLTPEEALAGMTRNAARALRMQDQIGTIETGKQADFVLWNVNSPESLVCALTDNPCRAVYKRGVQVHEATI